MAKNFRVDFKRPDSAGRMHKVFTFAIAKDESEAANKVIKNHPGSKVTEVKEKQR